MNILLCGFQVYNTLMQPFYTHPVLITTGALLNPQHPFPPSPSPLPAGDHQFVLCNIQLRVRKVWETLGRKAADRWNPLWEHGCDLKSSAAGVWDSQTLPTPSAGPGMLWETRTSLSKILKIFPTKILVSSPGWEGLLEGGRLTRVFPLWSPSDVQAQTGA